MTRVLLRLFADASLVALLLFTAAGTLAWQRGWILVAVLLGVRLATALAVYRVSPELLWERARLPVHRAQPAADRILVIAVLATGFLGLGVVAALDVFRWHVAAQPSQSIAVAGLALFTVGWVVKGLALYANAFAVTVVRLQAEREHAVVDSGVYSLVRHPFYAADPLIFVGSGLWLGSLTAALAAAVPIAMVVVRLTLEERFLRRELPGYDAYTARVPYRMVPWVW